MGSFVNFVICIPILAAAVYFLVYQQVEYDVHELHVDINKDLDSIAQWWRNIEHNLPKVHPFLLAVKVMDVKTNTIEVNGHKGTEKIQRAYFIENLPLAGHINMNFWFDVKFTVVQLQDTATVESKVLDNNPLMEATTFLQFTRTNGGGKTKLVEIAKVTMSRLMFFLNKDTLSGLHRQIVDNFKQIMESN